MAWTEEMIDTLKTLWDQGVSTGEIGKRLGVTKNSVVGKVHRLGLDGRPSPIKRKTDAPKTDEKETKKTKEAKAVKEEKPAKKVKAVKEEKPKEIEAKEEPKALPKKEKVEKIAAPSTKKLEHIVEEANIVVKRVKEEEVFKEGGCSLTELSISACRWPIGDPKDENFHFCGKKTKVGQTYCDEHSQVAYVKIIKK